MRLLRANDPEGRAHELTSRQVKTAADLPDTRYARQLILERLRMIAQVESILQNKDMVFFKSQLVPGQILHLSVDNDRGDNQDDGKGELKDHQPITEDQSVPVGSEFPFQHQRRPEGRENKGRIQTSYHADQQGEDQQAESRQGTHKIQDAERLSGNLIKERQQ